MIIYTIMYSDFVQSYKNNNCNNKYYNRSFTIFSNRNQLIIKPYILEVKSYCNKVIYGLVGTKIINV